jgi:excisionase family DNA binding protein
MNAPIKRRLLSFREIAQLLGVSERYIYNRVHRKAERKFPIKPKRIGRLIRFHIDDIDEFLNSLLLTAGRDGAKAPFIHCNYPQSPTRHAGYKAFRLYQQNGSGNGRVTPDLVQLLPLE